MHPVHHVIEGRRGGPVGVNTPERPEASKFRHPDSIAVIVPMHKELAPGNLRSIAKQAQTTPDELAAWAR
ncbi:MAG: type II toxin-antitoxin system HicA family toxin [Deltaproteobacteria bacterium]|nr:type II toxin-antitoxin system HicA family toxin [Deltaproteobacteria bacterium]